MNDSFEVNFYKNIATKGILIALIKSFLLISFSFSGSRSTVVVYF